MKSLPTSMREDLIVHIPKLNKDLRYCESFRSISLINRDHKNISKLLATQLNLIMPKLIKADQTGFIPGRSIYINLHRLFIILQVPKTSDTDRVLLALDTYKAFDLIGWPYLFQVLQKSFGETFISWIRILYADQQPI